MNNPLNIPGLCAGSNAKYILHFVVFSTLYISLLCGDAGKLTTRVITFTDNLLQEVAAFIGWLFSFLSLTIYSRTETCFFSNRLKGSPILKTVFSCRKISAPIARLWKRSNYTFFLTLIYIL